MVYAETGKEHETAVIVMLTQTHEQGREKCFQYFPADMSTPTFAINEQDEFADGFTGTLTLKSISEDAESRSTIRTMDLETSVSAAGATSSTHSDSASAPKIHKPIIHLLFAGWPDFLIPEGADRAALLNLITLSQKLNTNAENPRIVHCSAGVGRSGTFIALDYLLQEIAEGAWDELPESETEGQDGIEVNSGPMDVDGAGAGAGGGGQRDSMILTAAGRARDPVVECVDELRKQRMMMVQGEGQFAFLYDVCREVWVERWRQRQGQARN